jgi:hypothetical protein
VNTAERQPLPPYILPIVLAAIPLVYLIWTSHRLFVDVPIGDQWEMVERFDKFFSGTLTLNDVWRQHNEHRPMFPIIYMIGLGAVTGWNTGAEIASSVVMAIATFLLVTWRLIVLRRSEPAWQRWVVPFASLVFFSTVQWENWIQGWQLGVFMCVLFSVLGFRLLSAMEPRTFRSGVYLAGALVAGVIATYSFGSGIAYWVAGFAALSLNRSQRSVPRLLLWILVAGATTASYLYDYRPGAHSMLENFQSLPALVRFLTYIPQYLGGPVGAVHDAAAFVVGAGVLAAYVWLVVALWPQRHTSEFMFPATMGLNTVGIATITALGRAFEGFPTSSRYTTMAVPMWLAVMLLFALALTRHAGVARWIGARLVPARSLVACLCLLTILTGIRPLFWAQIHHDVRAAALLPLIRGDELPKLARLYANSGEEVLRRREVLKRLRLSVFRPGRYKL